MGTYLENTSQGTPTSTQIGTISVWVKMHPEYDNSLISNHTDTNNRIYFSLGSGGNATFSVYGKLSGSQLVYLQTTKFFRDPSAWYHVVLAYDTTQVTDTNRFKLYINGVQYTWDSATDQPAQDAVIRFNGEDNLNIGRRYTTTYNSPFSGYMSEFFFIDGTQYAASDFASADSTSGIWKPNLAPSVTYGNNGFLLKFENSGSSAAAGNFGSDSSGNDNHLTSYNLGSHPNVTDTPENNFCIINSAFKNDLTSIEDGATFQTETGGWASIPCTIGLHQGKWYWEYYLERIGNWNQTGIISAQEANDISSVHIGNEPQGYSLNTGGGDIYNNGSSSGGAWFGSARTQGQTIGVALDLTNNKLYFSTNGVWGNSSDPVAGTNGYSISSSYLPYLPAVGSNDCDVRMNFGNPSLTISSSNADDAGYGSFEYDVPAGYYSICTKNLATYG